MSYPVAPGASGTRENPFAPTDGPDADTDVEVTLTFWRQREALPDEPGRWMTSATTCISRTPADRSRTPPRSRAAAARAPTPRRTEPHTAQAPDFPLFYEQPVSGLQDSADDQPADPANTFTFVQPQPVFRHDPR